MEKWRKEQKISKEVADERIRESIAGDEVVGSIMEWTGPGVFTDSVMRYATCRGE